ncbi:alpha/beta hydrolase [Curtobacterium flaccumfaciens]|uniref:alpha/beta hydrolase n=1 Tax=Curtobacterium flaccumfaciens TaxID=2035 RepID=UPI001BDF3FC2|nr:alpha/beta hydrolase [Curtobacterium flaccumfaciens]MBT1671700.1 alpha/beta hydrolase [Curtobacterium flaccumfaciens pv. flaccumfaciens]
MRSTEPAEGRTRDRWEPDVLGGDYESLRLPLGVDDEGPVVATLVRPTASHRPPRSWSTRLAPRTDHRPLAGADVVYVHGWSDYFFQRELAENIETLGARFFAVDLRKYGRSLLPGQTPGYVDDLGEYDADLDAALAAIRQGPHGHARRRLFLLGHSTGGLTLALWTARHPDRVDGLILNSPWLEFQATKLGREVLAPLIRLGAKRNPLAPMPVVDPGFYTRTVSSTAEGSWTYDQHWRPVHGFPVHPGWLAAVFAGQDTVAHGLHLAVPVLVLLSTHSALGPRWTEEMAHADVALNVDAVAHRSLSLGNDVTVVRVAGALHDVMLSDPAVREHAYVAIRRWARAVPLAH